MKRNYYFIAITLLISLFIYLFYRTEKTVVTGLFLSVVSADQFSEMRRTITSTLPLNEFVIYSLPEGLWVFCISMTSRSLFIKIGRRELGLIFVPLIFSIGLELLQLLRFTNGRFDFWDIWISVFFWVLANYALKHRLQRQNIFAPFNTRSSICLLSYLIVYLAHVWQ